MDVDPQRDHPHVDGGTSRCPHGERLAVPPGEPVGTGIGRSGRLWQVHSLSAVRQVLRARHATTQAGFSAERIPGWVFARRPVLIGDGPEHDDQRRQVARFLAPAVVATRHRPMVERRADRMLARVPLGGIMAFDELALHYAVDVTAAIVGLTRDADAADDARHDRRIRAMSRRLEAFFAQPPLDMARDDLGRSNAQWMLAARRALAPLVAFHLADVRPAIRARRATRHDDIIGHLVAQGLDDRTILVEALTYGTAGMVTTREFICLAAWRLVSDAGLRARYLAADEDARHDLLRELLRLDPVVGHLYRRVVAPIEVDGADGPHTFQPGDLVDLCVRDANADPAALGPDALRVRPGRDLPSGVGPAVMSFGDGAHRCPGQPLAVLEADILLTRLLARRPVLIGRPQVVWNDLLAGYQVRDLRLRCTA